MLSSTMSEETSHPLQRRAFVREPVLLPVRLSFLGGTNDGGALAKSGTIFALGLDVSNGGMQLLVSGLVAKELLVELEVPRPVQLGFVHPELKRLGDIVARVRWSRAATERSECVIGIAFVPPLADSVIADVLRFGALPARRTRWWGWAAVGAVAALGFALLWLGAREKLGDGTRALGVAEQERDDCRQSAKECRGLLDEHTAEAQRQRAEQAALLARVAAASASSVARAPEPARAEDAGLVASERDDAAVAPADGGTSP
jgi:hypothetical protein